MDSGTIIALATAVTAIATAVTIALKRRNNATSAPVAVAPSPLPLPAEVPNVGADLQRRLEAMAAQIHQLGKEIDKHVDKADKDDTDARIWRGVMAEKFDQMIAQLTKIADNTAKG